MRVVGFTVLLSLLALGVGDASAFSLLGPLKNRENGAADPWQGRNYAGFEWGLGYELEGDIGGPMFLEEAYRWNVPTVFYGFDSTFLDYFGPAGVEAVEKGVAILNALPAASLMSDDLSEFPLDSRRQNGDATALQLLDLKSWTLSVLLEQMGLANPERFVWGLRYENRNPDCELDPSCGHVLNLNYDPVTTAPSMYVNDVLYPFVTLYGIGPRDRTWASAVEWSQFDPERSGYTSVAGGIGSPDIQFGPGAGEFVVHPLFSGVFFTGLTRDDAGGLRYLLRRDRKVWETLLPGVTAAGSNGHSLVGTALRGGVEKLNLVRLPWDANASGFVAVTNRFLDVYYTNEVAVTQEVQRVVVRPDILFRAEDLGGSLWRDERNPVEVTLAYAPSLLDRGPRVGWQNNAALNNSPGAGGPGVITPGAAITFNKLGRYHANAGLHWGSYDESDRAPVVLLGSETNHLSVTLDMRLVITAGAREFEWTVLLSRRWDRRYFHVETSVDLQAWQAAGSIDSFGPQQPIVAWRTPATNGHQFFRIREASAPDE